MPKSVTIIGCGWLGLPLAHKLLEKNYRVSVTTQSIEKQQKLSEESIDAEILRLPVSDLKSLTVNAFNQETLVISITPQIRQGRSDYPVKIGQLVSLAESGKVKNIILLSSTAVYNGLSGDVDEESLLDFSAEKVKIIAEAEQAAQQFSGNAVILRLAGLVGPDRHPGRFLQGKRVITEPQAYINLIHQNDAVGVLMNIITQENVCGIYNAVSATKASKKQYYQTAASALNLPAPLFSSETSSHLGKRINDEKLRKRFDYQFSFDDLIGWLDKSAEEGEHA